MAIAGRHVAAPGPTNRAFAHARHFRYGRPLWLAAGGTFLVALLALLAYLGICVYMADALMRPRRIPIVHTPQEYGIPYRSVQFPSRVDAVALDGWLLTPQGGSAPRRPVVMVHGKSSDRQRENNGHALDVAAVLVDQGHPVLMFDLRGSGRSGGTHFTLGAREVRDVGGAIDFLAQRGLAPDGVDLLGFSMGGSTALLLAPTELRVRAIAEDSAYAELGEILDVQIPRESGLPGFFTPGVVLAAWPAMGTSAYAIRPIDGMAALARRGVPLLVIHGEADGLVPVRHGRRIAAAYGPAAQTYFVPGGEHVANYRVDPSSYLARVTGFLAGAG